MRIHPGETLKEMMEDRGLSHRELVRVVHISALQLKFIVDGHIDIDKEIATELGKFFDTGAQFWLNLQKNYDEEKA